MGTSSTGIDSGQRIRQGVFVAIACALCVAAFPNVVRAQDRARSSVPKQASIPTPRGGGSTFVQPLLAAWAAVYKSEANADVEYEPVGSSQGAIELSSGTFDFGATDQPLTSAELAKHNLAQFPVAVGAIVPILNLEAVRPGDLHFTGPLLADIFAGKVRKWNDPAIARMNPAVHLPKAAITIVYRADSSGTTYSFTHYLSRESPSWKKRFGEGQTIKWGAGIAAVGNGSVAEAVKNIPNSIGYTEYAYVLTHDLVYACLQNSTGQVVCPSAETFANAVESTAWSGEGDLNMAPTGAPGARAYPIMATTFILLPMKAKDKARSDAALKFFLYGLKNGQDEAKALNYVPLPSRLVSEIESYLNAKMK